MGKASRKLNKKQQKETLQNQQAVGNKLREHMKEQENSMEYAAAIETLAELVEKKMVTAEDMYAGAQDYFMIGDYTRSGQCVNTVLTLNPEHIGARILLAKLCLNEERIDDALAIYDFVLQNFRSQLTKDQDEEILDSLRYYGRHESERLQKNYAACYAFFKQQVGDSSIAEDGLTQAVAAIACLKEDVEKHETGVSNMAASFASTPQTANIASQERQAVQSQQCSLLEKVRMLNRFAGAHFYKSDYVGAKELLTTALEIDCASDMSLRNLALLLATMGDKENAVEVASRMQITDFVLLQQLKK